MLIRVEICASVYRSPLLVIIGFQVGYRHLSQKLLPDLNGVLSSSVVGGSQQKLGGDYAVRFVSGHSLVGKSGTGSVRV